MKKTTSIGIINGGKVINDGTQLLFARSMRDDSQNFTLYCNSLYGSFGLLLGYDDHNHF